MLRPYRVAYEHPTQPEAATFLRALADGDLEAAWARLSRESRGLLEGRYAAEARIPLHHAASVGTETGDARIGAVVGPLREAALVVAGGAAPLLALGVSAARLVDRTTAFVLLLPDVTTEHIVEEAEWRPAHLLAFVYESREWLVDLGRTAELSADAGLPDPLGALR